MEVLISAFIMSVGLLGVAALLPVGHHEANKGMIADRAAEIGRQAFRDFQIRGYDPADFDDDGDGVYKKMFRSPDDDRFTYMVWARREPFNKAPNVDRDGGEDKRLNSNLEKVQDVVNVMNSNHKIARVKYFPLNYVEPQLRMEVDETYADVDNSKMRVVVFVFRSVDTRKKQFNPTDPAECAPENRPVAVFEKIMPVEGPSNWW